MRSGAIGERLQEIRARRSRREFAALYGIHEQSLIRYETKGRLPDKNFINRVLSGEGIEEKWLLEGEGGKYKEVVPEPAPAITERHHAALAVNMELLTLHKEQAVLLRENGDLRVLVERQKNEIENCKRQITALQAKNEELSHQLSLSAIAVEKNATANTA